MIMATALLYIFGWLLLGCQALMGNSCAKPPLQEHDGWDKAADYAFRYLENLGLVRQVANS
jgi:hypothetical protein